MLERVDSNSSLWTKSLKRLHCAPREVHRARSRGVNESPRRVFLRHLRAKSRDPAHYSKVTPRDSSTTLRSARKTVITYEKNRNTFWTGTEFSAGVCRSGESKTGGKDIAAEFVKIDKVIQGEPCGYDVVIDRISQDVPFYRAWLKNAALTGTAVVNNPFWWSADEKFFNNALATKIGVAVPRTVLLPSNQPPPDTNDKSFRNLGYPLDWEGIFNYVGWPRFSNRSQVAAGRTSIDCIIARNSSALTTIPESW